MNFWTGTEHERVRSDERGHHPGGLGPAARLPGLFGRERGACLHTCIYTFNVKNLWMLTQATMLFFRLLKEHANVYAFRNAYSNVLFSKYFCANMPESTSIGVLRYIKKIFQRTLFVSYPDYSPFVVYVCMCRC